MNVTNGSIDRKHGAQDYSYNGLSSPISGFDGTLVIITAACDQFPLTPTTNAFPDNFLKQAQSSELQLQWIIVTGFRL
jgi:hypothetical protein